MWRRGRVERRQQGGAEPGHHAFGRWHGRRHAERLGASVGRGQPDRVDRVQALPTERRDLCRYGGVHAVRGAERHHRQHDRWVRDEQGGYLALDGSYAGDAKNEAASSGCQAEQVTVTKARPSLDTTPSPSSGEFGATLNDSATLTDAFSPTGSIVFSLFDPDDATCAGTPAFTETVALSGNTAEHDHRVREQQGRHLALDRLVRG